MKTRAKIRRLGPFEIVKDLAAKGAQGKLYVGRALEPCFGTLATGSLVALKVMEVHDDDSEHAFKRLKFRTDALVAAANPGIVRYYGCFDASDESKDQHVIAMELLKGQTLEECLEQNRLGLDADQVLRIIRICTEALVTVAEYGLVHRDIKPSNIFLCENGGVKLIDFEIARQEGASRTTTESGAMRGTVDYMAPDFHPDFRPEKGFRGDECSDVFSLTVCLYEMLAGSRPYAVGGMMGEQSMMAYFQRWTKVAGTDVSKSLKIESYKIHALAHVQKVIKKGLSPERDRRYQTYREFWEALQNVKVREIASPEARYALLRCVGKGGFGVVFRARRVRDGLVVAIKCLLRAEYAERFTREARALARFRDDRIVSFVEYFSIVKNTDETHFIVMQFLDGMPGSSLRDRIATMNSRDKGAERIPFREILTAFKRYAGGLKILHDGGIIHRDIKPANLYMPTGAPEHSCVMDLGVVKTDETQTNGSLPGTLDYMPPEMALGQSRGTPAVDIYALGLCLHEALTGQPLYPRLKRGGDGLAEFYRRAKEAEPPDLSRLDSMPEWQRLVRDMTAHDVSRRIGNCAEVERRLDAIPANELPEPAMPADVDDFEDDTFAVPHKKVVRKFGSEVGLRFGQSSKSVSAFQGSDEETEELSSPSGKSENPDSLAAPATTEKQDKSAPQDNETKTAALAGETAAVAAADMTKTAVAKDDTIATNATNATFATVATRALGGKADQFLANATRAATETRPTAKIRKKATKPLTRLSVPEALELSKHKVPESGEMAPKPAESPSAAKAEEKAPATKGTDSKAPEKKAAQNSEQPALVVTRKDGVNPFMAIVAVIILGALGGGVFYMRNMAEKANNKIVKIVPYPKSGKPAVTNAPGKPTPPKPDPKLLEARKTLAAEKSALAEARTAFNAAKTLEAMEALAKELNARKVPSPTGYADIDKELEIVRNGFVSLQTDLDNKIKSEKLRQAAEMLLADEKAALENAQNSVAAAKTLDAMEALAKELSARKAPSPTGYTDIDKELGVVGKNFVALKEKLEGNINTERKRRRNAEDILDAERKALAKAQKDVLDAETLDKMQPLQTSLQKHQYPAKTDYEDIDKELDALKDKFKSEMQKLSSKIVAAQTEVAKIAAAGKALDDAVADIKKKSEDWFAKIKKSESNSLDIIEKTAIKEINDAKTNALAAAKAGGVDESKRNAAGIAFDDVAGNLRAAVSKRREAEDRVAAEANALATASNDFRRITSRTAFDALRTKLANRLKSERTHYKDLDAKLDAIDAAYGEMKRDLDGRRATLTLSNTLSEHVRYRIDGKSYEVSANGRLSVELPVWTSSIPVMAEVVGEAAADYGTASGSISTDGATARGTLPKPIYKGDPELKIYNGNPAFVDVHLDGETRRLASGETMAVERKPRSYATIEYSFGDEYELVPGATASTTVQLGAAGTSKTAQAPSLRIKPRIAIIENPLAGFAKWTLPDGRTLSESSLEVPLGDKNKIVLEPLKPDYALWPEYDRVELDVSGVKRGAGAQRLSFKPAVNVANRVANIKDARWNAFRDGKWYWLAAGPAYDESAEVRKAECEVLQKRIPYAFPSDITDTGLFVANWLPAAKVMKQLLSSRYDGIRTIDEEKLAEYREKFRWCNPRDLKGNGDSKELLECLQAIGAADGPSL